MNEKVPQQKENNGEGFVPSYVFDKVWQEGGNFSIPADEGLRIRLRQQFKEWTHYGIMWLPENGKARDILLARIAAIDAYQDGLKKANWKSISKKEN